MHMLLLKLLLLFGGGLFAIVGWRSRVWGLACIAALLPSYVIRFHLFGIPFTFLEFCILLLFFIFLLRDSVGKKFPWWGTSAWTFITVFLVAATIALIVTPRPIAGLGLWKAYILEPLLVFLMMTSVRSEKDVKKILYGLGIASIVVSSIAIGQYLTGWGIPAPWQALPDRRSVSVYGYPNAVGLFLAPIIVGSLGLLLFQRGVFLKIFCTPVVMLGILALRTAKVEGAEIAVLIAGVVLFLWTRWRWVALGCTMLGMIIAFTQASSRALLLFQDVSGDVRLALWQGTLNLLTAHPFVGAGLAGFPQLYDQYRLPSHVELLVYPHNLLFDFWTELGLLGALWVIGMFVWLFSLLWRHRKNATAFSKIFCGVFIAYLIYGMVDVVYFKNDLAVMFWMWIGLTAALVSTRAR